MKPGNKVSKLAQFTVQSCINKSSKWSVLSVKWSFAGPAKRYFLWASCENFVMFPIAIKQSFSKNIFFQIGHWQIVDLLEINAYSQLLFTAVCYCFCWLLFLNVNFLYYRPDTNQGQIQGGLFRSSTFRIRKRISLQPIHHD